MIGRTRGPAGWHGRLGHRHRAGEGGFTLIELLVVIIILGILAAVVVFAVGGVGDKGEAAATEIDRRTLATAEEAYFARNGRYGTEAELVGGGFLSEQSSTHKIYLNTAAGSCPAGSKCTYSIGLDDEPATLTVYIGRSSTLVGPLLTQFSADTGIAVTPNYGSGTGDKSTLLASLLVTEGAGTPADAFFAQDAANLGKVSRAGLFKTAPAGASGKVLEPGFQAEDNTWTAVSGRVRVIAHNPAVTPAASVPDDVDDLLTQPARSVGYDPNNASFQNFVAAMILQRGVAATQTWLNTFQTGAGYCVAGNRNIAAAVALNPLSIKLGLINHYYRFQGPTGTPVFNTADVVNTYPVSTLADPDPGSLINTAGIGILANTDSPGAAEMFVRYMLENGAQTYYKDQTSEYPVVASVAPRPELVALSSIQAPNRVNGLDLNDLNIDDAVAAETAAGMLPTTNSPTGTGAPNSCRSTIP